MGDFYERRDISTVTDFAHGAFHLFSDGGVDSTEQLVQNASDPVSGIAIEVSFDGSHVHARLESSGPSKAIDWPVLHPCRTVWVRRAPGTPAGTTIVEVVANDNGR